MFDYYYDDDNFMTMLKVKIMIGYHDMGERKQIWYYQHQPQLIQDTSTESSSTFPQSSPFRTSRRDLSSVKSSSQSRQMRMRTLVGSTPVVVALLLLSMTLIGLAPLSSAEPYGSRSYGSMLGSQDAIEEHDLLQAIRVPFDDPRTQYFEAGLDGFPAYGMRDGADIKSHYRLFLPDRLYRDFALLATVKPERREPAFLFAVVNPLDTIVQFGLKISPSLTSSHLHLISLLYTDVGSHLVTQSLASFEVPLMTRRWNRFALKVIGDNVTLFLNCHEHSSQLAMRNPKELSFDSASTLYIGQAGTILKGNFQVTYHNYLGVASSLTRLSFGSTEGSSTDFTDDLADFYDYPTYDDEDDLITDELGSAGGGGDGLPPPPPRPPPSLADHDNQEMDNPLFHQEGSEGGSHDKHSREPSPPILTPFVPTPKKLPGGGKVTKWYENEYESERRGSGGVCSCNHTEILLQLPETLRGLPGARGDSGPTGPAGPPGASGVEGRQGIRGEKGERGDLGARGPEGIQGPKGEAGAIGPIGLTGRPGAPGPAGSPTFLGLDDSLGGSGGGGVMARPGMPGPKGERGEQGIMGPKGEKGSMGDKGERGHVGARGDKGERGHLGSKGDVGAPGIDGFPGVQGKNGLKGDTGPMGPPGIGSGSITIEEILNTIDTIKGERGESGLLGPPGERGVPGLPGQKGDSGEQGPPGPAIQMDGTYGVSKGDKGDRGRRGKRGKPGLPGPPGEIGIPGWPKLDGGRAGPPGLAIQGPKGDKGEPAVLPENFFNYEVSGARGVPGLPGPPGPPGPLGPAWKPDGNDVAGNGPYVPVPGPPGPKGDMGPQGLPGLSIVGEQGDIGPIGPSGPAGAPGLAGSGGGEGSATKVVPGAVVFLSREGMLKMSEYSPLGTIAYVKDEESLFTRVSEGWKPILMGELIHAPPVMSHVELTTELPLIRPPFQASSLVNTVEGPSLRLAALNDPSNGDMRGVRGADYSCYRQARNSNLQGTFRAFLSSWVQNLDSIVKFSARNLPVVNTKGDVLFSAWTDMFQNGGKFVSKPPQIYSFNGRNVFQDFHWPQKMVWHGADGSGARAWHSYCDAWHTDALSNIGLASDLIKGELMGQEKISCNHKLIVLCIEIASQHHYRKRRRREIDDSLEHEEEAVPEVPHFPNFSKYSGRLHNLTFDEYTQFIDHYDQISLDEHQSNNLDSSQLPNGPTA